MSVHKDQIRALLSEHGLRATSPRLAVLQILHEAEKPLSHSEVLEKLGEIDWDPATIFRNLVKLREAGIAPVVSRLDGIDRYALKTSEGDAHQHPHFSCDDCGQLICLPGDITNTTALESAWAKAVQQASIQLRGQCPDCI